MVKTIMKSLAALFALVLLVLFPRMAMPAQSMFFRATTMGGQWDTWLYWHEGTYYLFLLAGEDKWHSIVMATSQDGVHWNETGAVLGKAPGVTWMGSGSTWKSPNYEKDKKLIWKPVPQESAGAPRDSVARWRQMRRWARGWGRGRSHSGSSRRVAIA
jgi:hypothetical protein